VHKLIKFAKISIFILTRCLLRYAPSVFTEKNGKKIQKKIQKIFPEKISKKVLQKKFPKKISKKNFQKNFQKKFLKYFRPKLLFIQFEVGLQIFWGSWPAGLVGDRERTDSTKPDRKVDFYLGPS
jgi:hypothetical protein